ncbi:MAG: carboxypeptidase-like regulatory domain-containing protein, partial [Pyrinomonadaceae bacterium]|nr:carboxypeptidase-like regulatory domain-containing protein [Pyrinomonadaceae bacterium]
MRVLCFSPSVLRTACIGVICSVTIVAFAVLSAYAQQSYRNTVNGFVFDSQRTPVTQIPVEITNEVGQVLGRTKTDGSGRYFFGGLSSGRFTIRVLPYGTDFEEQAADVEIVNFVRQGSSTSDSAQKDFYLRSRRRNPESRSVTGTLFAQEIPDEAKK